MARPEIDPTPEQRKQVLTLAGIGLSQEQICEVMELSRPTLRKHFKAELKRGKSVALSQALNALFANIKKGKEASIFFYLKTQHGWREKPKENEGDTPNDDRGKLTPPVVNVIRLPRPEK